MTVHGGDKGAWSQGGTNGSEGQNRSKPLCGTTKGGAEGLTGVSGDGAKGLAGLGREGGRGRLGVTIIDGRAGPAKMQ